jgi:hypothetical protein
VYYLSDFISVPEAASEFVIARNTEAVLSKASTHHATVRLSKKGYKRKKKLFKVSML